MHTETFNPDGTTTDRTRLVQRLAEFMAISMTGMDSDSCAFLVRAEETIDHTGAAEMLKTLRRVRSWVDQYNIPGGVDMLEDIDEAINHATGGA